VNTWLAASSWAKTAGVLWHT